MAGASNLPRACTDKRDAGGMPALGAKQKANKQPAERGRK